MDCKPDAGCKIQTLCCARTGILCQLLLVKSGSDEDTKTHTKSNHNAGTYSIIKLTKPWLGSNRVVVANSAFASADTAAALNKRKMGFIGVVKTATRRFPLRPLQETILPEKG